MTQGAEAIFAMGAAALEAQDLAGAERAFRSLVESDPRIHPAWNGLSMVAVRAGDPRAAVEYARRALELDRRNPLYLNNLGIACGELGQLEEAEQAFRRALKLEPRYYEGLYNLGKVLHKQHKLADALRAFERVYAMDSEFPNLRWQLASQYRLQGRAERALEVMREAPGGLRGTNASMYAECLAEAQGAESACRWLEAHMHAHAGAGEEAQDPLFLLGRLQLALGRWREGWALYHNRRRAPPPAPLPPRLDGKRILLRDDQGLGDVLFFLRFVPELQARGARVAVAAPAKLASVLQGFELVSPGEEEHTLLIGDLPAALGTSSTPGAVSLQADAARTTRWSDKLAALGPPPYLALTWRAGTDMLRVQDYLVVQRLLSKEAPLGPLALSVRGWRGTLLSLQRNPREGELSAAAQAAGARVHDLSAVNEDLAEMLALLSRIDEYVTVSNTNVHLLAGLGKTARVLVPQPPEWRWMHDGAQSPWFPGFSIYRQPVSRDWSVPLAHLRRDLFPT